MTTPVRPEKDAANTTVFDDDESIPVLTERLTLPALDLDFALPAIEQPTHIEPPASVAATTLLLPAEPPAPQPPAPPPPPTAEELRATVLQAVLEQLPAEIDSLVHQRLRPAVEAAFASLSAEANQTLRNALVEIVERAVRDALNKNGSEPG